MLVGFLISVTFFSLTLWLILGLVFDSAIHQSASATNITVAILIAIYLVLITFKLRNQNVKLAAFMLIMLYVVAIVVSMISADVSLSLGLHMFSFLVLLTGLLFGSAYVLPAAFFALLIILSIVFTANTSIFIYENKSEIILFILLFPASLFVTWIISRQVEQALGLSIKIKNKLQSDKVILEQRLAERTKKLQAAQLKEMQQLYRFAELGQLSTVLLHELANHLTVLTLDIEDVYKERRSRAIHRSKDSIKQLEELLNQARSQIQIQEKPRIFNIAHKIQESASHVSNQFVNAGVKLQIHNQKTTDDYLCFGDPLRFRQIVTILINNAIESHETLSKLDKYVDIKMRATSRWLYVTVTDNGVGISIDQKKNLFQPLCTTKQNGMGIGLFIARQIIQTHFKGTLNYNNRNNKTNFVIKVPRIDCR